MNDNPEPDRRARDRLTRALRIRAAHRGIQDRLEPRTAAHALAREIYEEADTRVTHALHTAWQAGVTDVELAHLLGVSTRSVRRLLRTDPTPGRPDAGR
ncbi:hypothetical protein [Embleya sp. NPDC020630]|uniref:hypothetical protein n=1 Tax=Embleya sp. NPDC020630 TaxID=3363979 RepID=UPI0037AF29DF